VDVAWSVFDEEAQHGRAAWTAVHPDGQWGIFGFFAGFEEPVCVIFSERLYWRVVAITYQKNVLML
jgi:hypothetical protein